MLPAGARRQGMVPVAPPALLRRPRSALTWVTMIVLGLGGLVIAILIFLLGGPAGALIATLLAAVSFPVLILVCFWLDRYEPEPAGYRLAALGWGAVAAVMLSFLAEQFLFGLPGTNEFVAAAVGAPVVEELTKGLFFVAIIVFRRSEIGGLLDGIIYGALVGIGFAFVGDCRLKSPSGRPSTGADPWFPGRCPVACDLERQRLLGGRTGVLVRVRRDHAATVGSDLGHRYLGSLPRRQDAHCSASPGRTDGLDQARRDPLDSPVIGPHVSACLCQADWRQAGRRGAPGVPADDDRGGLPAQPSSKRHGSGRSQPPNEPAAAASGVAQAVRRVSSAARDGAAGSRLAGSLVAALH